MSQKKAGVILTYLSQGVLILSSLFYTPIMLNILGQSEYGLYQLVYSVVSYLSLLSLGFTTSYVRFYTQAKTEGDNEVARINGMFMTLFLLMSLVCILAGILMVNNAEFIFGTGLSADEIAKSKILLGFMIFNMALTFPNSVFTCYISANENFIFLKGVTLLQNILHPFLCLPMLLLGYGSIGLVAVSTFLTVLTFSLNAFFCIVKLKMKFQFNDFNLSVFKSLGRFTFFIFLNQIIDQINWNLDKFLLGRFAGLEAVAIYGVGGQINTMYISFSNGICNVFVPEINRIVVNNTENRKLTDIFTRVGRVQFIIVFLMVSGFAFFGQNFIHLWAGNEYAESYWVCLCLMIPMFVPLIQNIGIEIQRAKNKHQVRSIVYALISIGNVIITIPLITLYGAIGAALGTGIALIIGNNLFMNIYYKKALDIDIPYFWKNISEFIPSCLLAVLSGLFINNFINMSTWFGLIFGIIIYIVIYAIAFLLFGMNKYEKSLVSSLLKKILK